MCLLISQYICNILTNLYHFLPHFIEYRKQFFSFIYEDVRYKKRVEDLKIQFLIHFLDFHHKLLTKNIFFLLSNLECPTKQDQRKGFYGIG